MLWATVPKTTVQKDCNASASLNKIRLACQIVGVKLESAKITFQQWLKELALQLRSFRFDSRHCFRPLFG